MGKGNLLPLLQINRCWQRHEKAAIWGSAGEEEEAIPTPRPQDDTGIGQSLMASLHGHTAGTGPSREALWVQSPGFRSREEACSSSWLCSCFQGMEAWGICHPESGTGSAAPGKSRQSVKLAAGRSSLQPSWDLNSAKQTPPPSQPWMATFINPAWEGEGHRNSCCAAKLCQYRRCQGCTGNPYLPMQLWSHPCISATQLSWACPPNQQMSWLGGLSG